MQRLASRPAGWLGSPERGKEAVSRPAIGRVCEDEECSTILSTYNTTPTCWVHREHRYQRSDFRP